MNTQRNKETLERFVLNYDLHNGENTMDNETASETAMSNTVEILNPDISHRGNGLLVTKNGYFVTSYHVFEESNWKNLAYQLRLANGLIVPSWVMVFSKKEDMALCKTLLPIGKNEPNMFNFYDNASFTVEPVVLLTRWDGEVNPKYGTVSNPFYHAQSVEGNETNRNQFSINLKIRSGDSGGIVLGPKSSIMGILNSANEVTASATRFDRHISLMRYYINKV